jgi:hypothetical protein
LKSRAFILLLMVLGGCHRAPSTLEPDEKVVASMPDPYAVVGTRGSAPALERATAVMKAVGGHVGLGSKAAEALRAHENEAWAKRVVLLLDLGGDAQLEAAWSDLMEGTLAASRVSVDVKREVRQSQARVLDTKGPASLRRRRLLAEMARVLALLGA